MADLSRLQEPPILSKLSGLELYASLSESAKQEFEASLTPSERELINHDWRGFQARPNQLPPGTEGSSSQRKDWNVWTILAGRGFGKTRTGAETIREWSGKYRNIHLVGATSGDVRDVMVEGESGILNCFLSSCRPVYEPSKRRITFPSGAVAHLFSADEPERLRGPQCECFWADELAAWRFCQDAWDNLMFGFRLGPDPRGVITTTPKPVDTLKDILKDSTTVVTKGSSYDNQRNLSPKFFDSIIRKYEGTRLGRQEIEAELLEDTPGALWTQALIDAGRWHQAPADYIIRIVVSIDPAVSVGEDSADTGIVVCALLRTGHVLVLNDLTCHESPAGWARAAIAAFRSANADRIIGEINNGGDLVEANIRAVDANVPFRSVRASRGKAIRAEPVAALYEQGRVHHIGNFPLLESQMTTFVPGMPDGKRLDRMDALVWAITELVIDVEQIQTTRSLVMPVTISPY